MSAKDVMSTLRRCVTVIAALAWALACHSPASPTEAPPRVLAPAAATPIATDDAMKALALERAGTLAHFFVASFSVEQIADDGTVTHRVCPEPRPLPPKLDPAKPVLVPEVAWSADPGWHCLHFAPYDEAHWFQYEVRITGETHAVVIARRHDLEIDFELIRVGVNEWLVRGPTEKKP